jgi:hypothetical protein
MKPNAQSGSESIRAMIETPEFLDGAVDVGEGSTETSGKPMSD